MHGNETSARTVAALMQAWMLTAMRRSQHQSAADLGAHGAKTLAQIVAMHIAAFEGPLPLSRLTERLGMSTSAVSHLVQRLVEQGLLQREEDPSDRRQRLVAPTRKGRAAVDKMMASRLAELTASIEPLSPGLRQDLAAVLQRVLDELAVLDDKLGHDTPSEEPA